MASQWHSGALLNNLKSEEFISGLAPRSFPSIEGNSRGADLEMKAVLYRLGAMNEAISEWHPSGSSGTAVVQVILHWRIGSPLVVFALNLVSLVEKWSEWHSSGTLAQN